MTSESDSTSGGASGSGAGRRPPPTIELTATEVEQPRQGAKSEPAGGADKTEHAASGEQAEAGNASQPKAGARWGAAPLTHVVSAVIGAMAATAVLVGLWLAGFTVAHDVVNSQIADTVPSDASNTAITARLDKIERALQAPKPATASVPPALANRLAAVEMQAKMLGDSSAALNHRLDEIAATAQTAQNQAATSAATAEDAAKDAGQAGVQRGDLDTLTTRIAALESAVQGLSEKIARPMTGVDRAVRLSVAAQALRTAVETGVPYQAELKAVQDLGAAPSVTAPLEPLAATGLPPAETLARQLAALVPALRAAANPASGNATLLDKLKANAQKLVHVTPVDAPPGNDPADVITRIDIDANRAAIGAAVKDVAALPDQLKSLTADWAKTAQAREKALAASRNISAEALAALSKPAAQ